MAGSLSNGCPVSPNQGHSNSCESALNQFREEADSVADAYPAPYRQEIVRAAKARKLDPRFILAIIRQESVFKPMASLRQATRSSATDD
jgi:soluble lytic murein transglycosylase-like protein